MKSILHQALKDSTLSAHTAIEQNPFMKRLLAPDLRESEFREILIRYYGYYQALKDLKNEYVDEKMLDLAHDLLALGLTQKDLERLPVCAFVPLTDTIARRTGVVYVMEGSAIGGKMIAQHLQKFPFTAGCRFFSNDAKLVSGRWKSFLTELERLPQEPEFTMVAVETAKATFESMDRWMASGG